MSDVDGTDDARAAKGDSLLEGFKGFAPIDEPPDPQLPQRWWTWGHWCGLTAGTVVTLVIVVQGFTDGWPKLSIAVPSVGMVYCVGFLVGARWGSAVDKLSRQRDQKALDRHMKERYGDDY